ncbi:MULTISPECIES: hypothetical protein [Pectobacterium]|uniref:Uncharacterized protein n=3 Tax=Pectobacterium parmentieri TaxID=1905730 RepID=A0A0H3I4B7_PECPM|nr:MULTISPECIES: hypothetical protein [Pectobacterium]AFI90435.1 Hypothetical protein W5S_2347 [Pectobacterium parmentieri]MBT9183299.1 hypothetical protein [Pectobacterium punjabense]MCL6382834.1 hypothetical protein [Pectobacterium parmentieri]
MNNLKSVLDVCDIFISGSFVELREIDFYPECGLHALVIKKMNFGFTERYSILVPAADWDYVCGLGLQSGNEILVPVIIDFNFQASHPLIWLSDGHGITKKQ